MDSENKMFSSEKLEVLFKKHGKESPDEIKNAIMGELKQYTCSDDVTMVVLKRRVAS